MTSEDSKATAEKAENNRNELRVLILRNAFCNAIMPKIGDVVRQEVEHLIRGVTESPMEHQDDVGKPPLDPSVADKIAAHYEHAREKHPRFADWLFKAEIMADPADEADFDLRGYRSEIVQLDKLGNLPGDFLVKCEIAEAAEAAVRGDKSAAVEECYDAIAVLLRMVDVLEGRQMLGDPAKKYGAKKEGDAE